MTTKTIRILRLMADGRSTTIASIVAATGNSAASARNAVSMLIKGGYVVSLSRPTTGKGAVYRITFSGMERSKFVPKTRVQVSRERYLRLKKAKTKAEAKAARVTFQQAQKATLSAQRAEAVNAAVHRAELHQVGHGLVAQGRATRTPLEMAWRGANA